MARIPEEKVVASAAAFVPKLEPGDEAQVESIRKEYDKAFARWPPHVTLLFPFVPEASMAAAVSVAEHALRHVVPFTIRFDTLSHFEHARSVTLFATPTPSRAWAWTELHAALEGAFPWCDEQGAKSDGFTAHMTLGQFPTVAAAQSFAAACGWRPFSMEVTEIAFLARSRATNDRFVTRHVVRLGTAFTSPSLVPSAGVELSAAEREAEHRVVAWLRARVAEGNAPKNRAALVRAIAPLCRFQRRALNVQALLATLCAERCLTIGTDDSVTYTPAASAASDTVPWRTLPGDADDAARVQARARQWLRAQQVRPRTKQALVAALSQLCIVTGTVDAERIVDALERASLLHLSDDYAQTLTYAL